MESEKELEKIALQTVLNNLKAKFITSMAEYLVLGSYSLEEAEKTLKNDLPKELQAPSDYKIEIRKDSTGEEVDRSQPLPDEVKDSLILKECRKFLEGRIDCLDEESLKEFKYLCTKMDE